MSQQLLYFCNDPKYAKEVPACLCLTATSKIDEGVDKILKAHADIKKENEDIDDRNGYILEETSERLGEQRNMEL